MDDTPKDARWGWSGAGLGLLIVVAIGGWAWGGPAPEKKGDRGAARTRERADRRPKPGDDQTFRPTVLVRKGLGLGSGTVIASVPGETLVLTASHVVKGPGRAIVELHRFNLGLERAEAPGRWPREVEGEIAAADVAADLALVRLRGLPALPYVARLAALDTEPERGEVVVSVGYDGGGRPSSWRGRVSEVAWLALDDRRGGRPFLITTVPPDRGRSGGGLFRNEGELTGVCVGRAEMTPGRTSGVFASAASIRRLLRDHELTDLVSRGEPGRALSGPASRPASAAAAPGLTPTRAGAGAGAGAGP